MTRNHVDDQLLCPSAPAEEGALVLGVVTSNGTVSYLVNQIPASGVSLK